ncbi:MAG: malonic semialdehyde reductase [Candidatus Puniceispirillum sp.]|nr:malonic semialdehyde reductase [Candidatus Pelagibacter sp.]MBA4282831.1 malonic semialdehyde reductase [Candidatus Puniceispirillum sp.]
MMTLKSVCEVFEDGRSFSFWKDKPVEDLVLKSIYDKVKWGATSANCSPIRVLFVKSTEQKEKLKSCLYDGNIEKTMTAPVTALFATDMKYYEKLDFLFPPVDAKPWFTQSEKDTFVHGLRNSSLQAAYFMTVARAYGLDCGPMSGYMEDKVNETFFGGTDLKINFMCNLGYGDSEKLHDRLPRFSFEEVCSFV